MYAHIVVLTYQGPDIQIFTYQVPESLEEKIKIGQIVSIPFGKRTPLGLIIALKKQRPPEVKTKPIISIVFPKPLLIPYQIKLLQWLSFYYHAPMVNCLEAMLPEIPRCSINHQAHLRGVKAHPGGDGYQQTLVLAPTINRIPETLAKYPTAKSYLIYHNELKTSERFSAWLKILSGKIDFVFGTRSAIFTPNPALAKMIIYDEHDAAYKDERSPYFDTLTCAQKLHQLTKAKIQIIDSSPKIVSFFVHRSEIQLKTLKVKTKIISMIDERKKGNKLPIADLLADLLVRTLAKGGQSLLFLNKKAQSGHLYCRGCGYHQFVPKQPELCPNCQSPDIWFNSLNIQSLAATVRKMMPAAPINLIAEGFQPTTNYQPHTIDIATSYIFYALAPRRYDLVAHIATDSILAIPDFAANEKVYAQITDLKKLTKGLLILQTYNPDHPTIKAAAFGNYYQFFKNHLQERKALSYPPFAFLVKLTLKGKEEELVAKRAEKLCQDLHQLNTLPATILGPYQSFPQGKSWRYNIILKTKVSDYDLIHREQAIKSLTIYLDKMPKDWQITVEPASIN